VQNQGIQRQNRSSITKSLIIGENANIDVPEDNSNIKKDLFKNIPNKQYRLSDAPDDSPQGIFKKEELGMINSPKETKFLKKESFE